MRVATAIWFGPSPRCLGRARPNSGDFETRRPWLTNLAAPMNGDLRESTRQLPYRGLFRARMIAALSSPPYTKIAAIE
jgi:hypothetical protein